MPKEDDMKLLNKRLTNKKTIKEAWGIIAGLNIELVEQYSEYEYDRWRDAVQTIQKFLQPILEEPKAETKTN